MGKKALQSSWVQRLRPGGESQSHSVSLNPRERELDSRPEVYRKARAQAQSATQLSPALKGSSSSSLREEKAEADSLDMQEKSRCVIYPNMLPKVESVFAKPKPTANPWEESRDMEVVTETHVIASFGPFQVRARSLKPQPHSQPHLQPRMDTTHRPPLLPLPLPGPVSASAPSELWKKYSQWREKKDTTELTSYRTEREKERQDYRGEARFLASACSSPCYNVNDHRMKKKKRPSPDSESISDSDLHWSTKQKPSQFQWQQPKNYISRPGFCKEIVASSEDQVHVGGRCNHRREEERKKSRDGCERPEMPFANANARAVTIADRSRFFQQCATTSALPSSEPHPQFRIGKERPVPENRICSNDYYAEQHAIWKAGSEPFPNAKSNTLDPASGGREHSYLPSHSYEIGRESSRLNSMEYHALYKPNYPRAGDQKDKIKLSDNSSSAASLPCNVYSGLVDRTKDENKFSNHTINLRTGTAFRDSDCATAYNRPTREKGYMEVESNSSHHSNCPGLDREDNNREIELSKRTDIARDGSSGKDKGLNLERPFTGGDLGRPKGWSDGKGKGLNLERSFSGGDSGYAFRFKSYDKAMQQSFQENYTVALSHRSDFLYLSSEVQPVAFHISAREEEIPRRKDGNEEGNLVEGEKISTKVQCALQVNESPGDNISFSGGKINLNCHEFHHFKSRKHTVGEGPISQRLHILSDEREAELDCKKHVRLKISAADGQASNCGKRSQYAYEELVSTDAAIATKMAIVSEANTVKDGRPEMWLQRWMHAGRMGSVNEHVPQEDLNCNSLKEHGLLNRTSNPEWLEDKRKMDFIHWRKHRKENCSLFSGSTPEAFRDRNFNSDLKGSQFMKKLTSSASAMAIIRRQTKEMYAAQPHRKEIFPVWASTWRADADAKETRMEIRTPDELEVKPKKAFEQEMVEQKDICVGSLMNETLQH